MKKSDIVYVCMKNSNKGKKTMLQIVTLLDQKITEEEKKLSTLIQQYQHQVVLLDTDNYNIESIQLLPTAIKNKKDLIKALKQIKAKLLKLLKKSD